MYDYVYEMVKEYHAEDDDAREFRINYEAIAEKLCIASRKERWAVSSDVKEQFRRAYETYVERRIREIKDPLAIIMFQGTFKPIVPRNQPRRGMVYIEDNLRKITDTLPKLSRGEKYVFPALKIIRAENGTDVIIMSR